MRYKLALASLAVFFLSLFAGNSQASLQRVVFSAWTQTGPGQPNKLVVFVEVQDNQLVHPPDYVAVIKVAAPDGTIFYLHPTNDWLPWDKGFYRDFVAADFTGAVIPGGDYTVTVTHKNGGKITEKDNLGVKGTSPSFLSPPVVTYPTANQTGVPATPTFSWKPDANATYYRILLFNKSYEEPVYFYGFRVTYTDFPTFKKPSGDLKPNCNYKMMIDARAGSLDTDMRSGTGWINFSTGSW